MSKHELTVETNRWIVAACKEADVEKVRGSIEFAGDRRELLPAVGGFAGLTAEGGVGFGAQYQSSKPLLGAIRVWGLSVYHVREGRPGDPPNFVGLRESVRPLATSGVLRIFIQNVGESEDAFRLRWMTALGVS